MKCYYCNNPLNKSTQSDIYFCFYSGTLHTKIGLANNQITFAYVSIILNNSIYKLCQSIRLNHFLIYQLIPDQFIPNEFSKYLIFKSTFQPLDKLEDIPNIIQRYVNLKAFI